MQFASNLIFWDGGAVFDPFAYVPTLHSPSTTAPAI
jgi:hypothetical protein